MEPESGKFIFRATTHSVSTRSMLFLFAALLATLSASAHADGQEAVSKAQELMPDVILMDVRLPKRSGI